MMVRLLAKTLWDLCEFYGIRCPFAPQVFGWMIGVKGVKVDDDR